MLSTVVHCFVWIKLMCLDQLGLEIASRMAKEENSGTWRCLECEYTSLSRNLSFFNRFFVYKQKVDFELTALLWTGNIYSRKGTGICTFFSKKNCSRICKKERSSETFYWKSMYMIQIWIFVQECQYDTVVKLSWFSFMDPYCWFFVMPVIRAASSPVLWIRIRKDPKRFEGSGSVIQGWRFGFQIRIRNYKNLKFVKSKFRVWYSYLSSISTSIFFEKS
jgi:hypothetical protein